MRKFVDMKIAVAWAFAVACVVTMLAVFVVTLGAQANATRQAAATTRQIAAEGLARRDQTCRLFERQELTEINRVIRTYAYLDALPRSERGSTLTKAIVAGLTAQREDAEAAIAPSYCNEGKGRPVIGLPEAPKYQAVLPPKRDFSRLLTK